MGNTYRQIQPDEIKPVLLNMLIEFHEICVKNNLRYSLAFGSLLGAIRHKGFIPWDDDVDVFMPRPDYNRLLSILENNTKYKIYSLETIKEYASILPKFVDISTLLEQHTQGPKTDNKYELGLYIDIFVLDQIPNSSLKQKIIFKVFDIMQLLWGFAYFKPSGNHPKWIELVRQYANKTSLSHYLAYCINCFAKKKRYSNPTLYSNLLQGGLPKWCYIISDQAFNNLSLVSFEDHFFYAISDYNNYLNKWYGDYMKLPPLSERVSNHDFTAWYKN